MESIKADVDEVLRILFDKKFEFSRSEDWVLPSPETLFTEPIWKVENLISLKRKLNETKSLLNDKDETWHNHTDNINRAGLIVKNLRNLFNPEVLTNAWIKFFEILSSYPLIYTIDDCFRSLHLCEAPGAFISALNYYLCLHYPDTDWDWRANTLNPYYEGHSVKKTVVDDHLIFNTMRHWLFGQENTGDITSHNVIKDIADFMKSQGPVHLVTADGSFDCTENPGEQELCVSDLHHSEILTCLITLAPHGNFVIKKFTFFECVTVCHLYLLNCLFDKVHVFKPASSKSGNSEVYVVCLDFHGKEAVLPYLDILQSWQSQENVALFPQSSVPSSFITQVEECGQFFANHQITSIEENLKLFVSMSSENLQQVNEVKSACVTTYFSKYSVDSPNYYIKLCRVPKRLISPYGIKKRNQKTVYIRHLGSTFVNIEHRKEMSLSEWLDDFEHRLNECFPISVKRTLPACPAWHPVWMKTLTNMKKHNYEDWMTIGSSISCINNSKFCNPVMLSLWNEIMQGKEISAETHAIKSHHHWNWEDFDDLVVDYDSLLKTQMIVHVCVNHLCDNVITSGLTYALEESIVVSNCDLNSLPDSDTVKIFLIDPTYWGSPSFSQELLYKRHFVEAVLNVIKVLHIGDSVVLHVQSLLSRFQVGMLYMLMSLFEKIATVLPESIAPALCGQIWILSNYQNPAFVSRVQNYLEQTVLSFENTERVLEVVPVTVLCDDQFYEYLVILNNHFMLQRLRKLVTIEKCCLKNQAR